MDRSLPPEETFEILNDYAMKVGVSRLADCLGWTMAPLIHTFFLLFDPTQDPWLSIWVNLYVKPLQNVELLPSH